jgi:hypothetical protein
MNVERIDHIHIKVHDQPTITGLYEKVLGTKMLMEADFTDDSGMRVAYNPFPIGLELMEVTDTGKEMAKIYEAAPEGVFALSLKVPDIEDATADMESMGHKLLMRYDFGEIKEALFDSKKALGLYIELIEYATENITDADDGGVSTSGQVRSRTSEQPTSLQTEETAQEQRKMTFSIDSKVGDLMKNPAAKAVIDEFLPEAATNPQTKMAYGMSLKMLANFPQAKISKGLLAQIDARLQALG